MNLAKPIISALFLAAAWLPLHAELEIPCIKDRPVIDGKVKVISHLVTVEKA